MFPVDFGYVRATSLTHALSELAGSDDVKLLAGGQSLLPMMKLRLAAPETVVDIGGLPELTGVRRVDGTVQIGSATTYRALQDLPLPVLSDALAVLADPQVRARGTVGGAVAHADPAADLPAVLLALDAGLSIAGPSGTRAVALDAFLQGPYTTDLAEDEILTAISFAAPAAGTGQAYEKFEQPASHLPLAGVCASLTVTDGVIAAARLAVTGVAGRAFRSFSTERALVTLPATLDSVREAAALVPDLAGDLRPLSDQHASAAFRLHLAEVLARRALTRALSRSLSDSAAASDPSIPASTSDPTSDPSIPASTYASQCKSDKS